MLLIQRDELQGKYMTIQRLRLFEIMLAILFCILMIEVVIFKYIPDVGTASYQNSISSLTSFDTYSNVYMAPGSVHHARFLGNLVLWHIADIISGFVHSVDMRLHPLRIAAAILTPFYFVLGVIPALLMRNIFDWKYFIVFYAVMFFGGLYVFYPCDAPALAGVSWAFYFLFQRKYLYVLAALLITGLFRESAFHIVVLAGIFMLTEKPRFQTEAIAWMALLSLAFLLEYIIVRKYYPGPISVNATTNSIDFREMFFGKGLWSLTSSVTLLLLALFPVFYWVRKAISKMNMDLGVDSHLKGQPPFVRRFFWLNCAAIPLWIVFYRAMGGNMTEFRIFWPVLLPVVYGIAWSPISEEETRRLRYGSSRTLSA